ncbi:glycoside hydrolase family 17 protein [Polychaeton citri CBS 116435]|uniref:Probable glucan endo-1,3-beta-glucosidase eglC n=1 Tax=Polychaeton citri CBS 116435 TaxID=1314669 RepID=A0A9P4QFT6_9PEZI|nr:glycoside hydrolase family 17 protein [Polychaeton citri CBS 116435]
MVPKSLVALAATIAAVEAQYKGFNYGSTFTTGAAKQQSDFEAEFNKAKSLPGADCFSAARLYTNIQAGTANTPISAIPAAISTKTQLLLGLWASAGQDVFTNEVQSLLSAIEQYGSAFTDLLIGVSVGSEDLYRISPTGIENDSGLGAGPDVLSSYVGQLRSALQSTTASDVPIGHVDTWTAWVNGSNNALIEAVDWLGHDGYPYFETTTANSIENGNSSFFTAYEATVGAAQGKPVWVTETGWPVSGPQSGQASASIENAKTYWDDVACTLLGNVNTFWYTLQDAAPGTPSPSFGIIPSDLSADPLFDLTCPAGTNGRRACGAGGSSSSSSSSSASSASSSVESASAPSSTAAATTASIQTGPASESLAPSTTGGEDSSASASSAVSSVVSSSASSVASESAPAPTTGADGRPTYTTIVTSWETVTSCPGGCSTSVLTLKSGDTYVVPESCPGSTPASSAASSASSVVSSAVTTVVTSASSAASTPGSSATTPAQPSGSACPTNLSGEYQYPHLIIPVSKSNPEKAYGTQYNATISPDVSTIFNFDIPASYAGQTCSLVFLFPEQKDLETTAFDFNGQGGISVSQLSSPATEQTTYSSLPSGSEVGSVSSATPGNGYVVTSGSCAAGSRVGYEFSSTGGLDLTFFNDWNPSPLGAFITVC